MKHRNGFVSNSSSASFLIAFPKNGEVLLKDIEAWLGGYNKSLDPVLMTMIGFQFWKTQYFDEDMIRRDFTETGKEYEFHKCTASWAEKKELWTCPKFDVDLTPSGERIFATSVCQNCKYHAVETRIDRSDDYYQAIESSYSENALNWLDRHKDDKIIYFEVDDNNPSRGLGYDVAVEITSNADRLFEQQTDNIYCLGGK